MFENTRGKIGFPSPNTGSISPVELIVLDSLSFHFLLSVSSLFVNVYMFVKNSHSKCPTFL